MKDRSDVQNTDINNSFKSPLPFALEDYNSYQHPLTTTYVKKVLIRRRYHPFQSHSSSRNNSRPKRVIYVINRTSTNTISPTNRTLSDYNDPSQLNMASIQTLRHDRKTSVKSNDVSPSNFGEFGYFHGSEGKVAQSSRRQLTYKDDRQSKNGRRRRRKCCGGGSYCCPCSLLSTLLSIIVAFLLAATIAALIIALLQLKSVIATSTATTATSTTKTTSSSTSATSTSSTTTTMTTSTTTSTSSTTTTPRTMCPVTQPGDLIHGLYSTTAGGSTVGFEGRYSGPAEDPVKAIDNDLTTKYLNFGANGTLNFIQSQPGTGTGFYVTPTMSNATVANGLLFATGNDYPERDPLTVTLEGTNSTALNSSSSWTLVYSGASGIDPLNTPSRSTYGTLQIFSNTNAYQSYRLLITSQRGAIDAVQYSECHIMTYC